MSIAEMLFELITLCGNNDVEFVIQTDGNENYVVFNDKKLIINIIDIKDKKIIKTLEEKIEELQKLQLGN